MLTIRKCRVSWSGFAIFRIRPILFRQECHELQLKKEDNKSRLSLIKLARRSLESEQTHELLEVLLGSLMWLLQQVGVAAPPLNPFLNRLQRWALQLVWPSRPSPYHQAHGPNNYEDTKP
jgi:hypothetical protein